jgi:endo-1,4-beta-xylanase
MRFTGPTFLNLRSLRFAAVSIFLFSASLSSCSSSLEEDLVPVANKDNSVGDVNNTPGQSAGDDSSAGEEGTGNDTGQGEPDANGGTTPGSETPNTPAAPAQPATPQNPGITPPQGETKPTTVLKDAFDFPIGAAVVYERLKNEPYSSTLKREFSRLSSESNFKFHMLQPQEGKFDFAKADAIVAFAQQHNMKVHGHTLIWALDGITPRWVLEYKGGEKEFDALLKNHISTVLKHFKGKVSSWDVVNEALTPSGGYVDNIWLRKLGEGYLLKALKYAQEADPSVKLFLNDYSQEYGGKKLTKYLKIVDEARANGIKVDGLGFQMHTVLRVDAAIVKQSFTKAAAKNLLIHLSEFDVSLKYQKPATFELTDELSKAQGAKVKELVNAYLTGVPKHLQFGITTWGVSDKDSYFNRGYSNFDHDYPLLFDRNYNPKDAYYGFLNAGLGK